MDEPRRWIPYCGEAPGPEVWLSQWNLDPVLGAILVLLAVTLWRSAGDGPSTVGRRRSLRWAGGLAVLLYVSPLCALSSAFFSVRVVHHMALVLLIAPLLVHGVAPRLRRVPVPLWSCSALAAVTFWAWHAPAPYAAALSSVPVYVLMQLTLLVSAMGFWAAVGRAHPPAAMAAILATMLSMGLLGALILFAARPLYPPHYLSALSWGVSPLEDQQWAGLTMWAPGSIAYLAAAILTGWRWMRAEGASDLHAAST